LPKGTPMTRDRARKRSIRARMTVSGESYSVAARKLAGEAGPGDVTAISLLADRVNVTLAAPSARVQIRGETDIGTSRDPRKRLARFIGDAVVKRMVPGMPSFYDGVRQEGFVEPAAGRFQVYWGGGYTTISIDGQQFFGRPGELVKDHPAPGDDSGVDEFLGGLGELRGATGARFSGEDVVRDAPCRVIAVEIGSRELTVWVDDVHIRRVREEHVESSAWLRALWGSVWAQGTVELWDFGIDTAALDWSRFPDSRPLSLTAGLHRAFPRACRTARRPAPPRRVFP
jgi:hypothetical protein